MKKIDSIHQIYNSEIDLIIKQSSILLQKSSNGLDGELKTSGAIVENYVKGIMKKHIPAGYRVWSGYIATTESIANTDNLAQHDLIIVDERIASLYKFDVSDIEIIPAEAVCGIIEVKRTLTRKSLKEATEHLRRTKNILDKYDDGIKSKLSQENSTKHSNILGSYSPIYAIISLQFIKKEINLEYVKGNIEKDCFEFIDLVWSLSDGFLITFLKIRNSVPFLPDNTARELSFQEKYCININSEDPVNFGIVFQKGLTALRVWITNTHGAGMDSRTNMKYFGTLNPNSKKA